MAINDDDAPKAKRVLETGIALVHRGELVLPAVGSEAQAAIAGADARTMIEYHFPVEIEIVGAAAPLDLEAISRHVFDKITRRLREGR
ncbi:MAG: hypothetical protein ABI467_23440 [Kofleriaceae bacterium]